MLVFRKAISASDRNLVNENNMIALKGIFTNPGGLVNVHDSYFLRWIGVVFNLSTMFYVDRPESVNLYRK